MRQRGNAPALYLAPPPLATSSPSDSSSSCSSCGSDEDKDGIPQLDGQLNGQLSPTPLSTTPPSTAPSPAPAPPSGSYRIQTISQTELNMTIYNDSDAYMLKLELT